MITAHRLGGAAQDAQVIAERVRRQILALRAQNHVDRGSGVSGVFGVSGTKIAIGVGIVVGVAGILALSRRR